MPLKKLMSQSDIVTLHTPNTPETRGMIDKDCFYSMKKIHILSIALEGQS